MKPVNEILESSAFANRQNLPSNVSSSACAESKNSALHSFPEKLADDVVTRVWARMTAIYGHKWTSHLGLCSDASGELTEAAKTWQRGLAGLTVKQIGRGFSALITSTHEWPPSLPEFRKLCMDTPEKAAAPSLDEVALVLTRVRGMQGSLAKRYRHPLCLAVARHESVDLFALSTAKLTDAKQMIRFAYTRLVDEGWADWPENAHEEQKAITREIVVNKELARSAMAEMRKVL
jgi:hypothetical protein